MLAPANPSTQASMARLLGVDDATFVRIHHDPAPKNLGIMFLGFIGKTMTVDSRLEQSYRLITAQKTLAELMELPDFRRQFLPQGVDRITVDSGMYLEPESWEPLLISPLLAPWRCKGLFLQVALFNGCTLSDGEKIPLAVASHLMDRWHIDSGSSDPNASALISLSEEAAEECTDTIGSTYSNGIGVWPEMLQPFRNAVMVGTRAFLEGRSLAKSMQEFANSGCTNYWESLKPKR